MSCVNVSEGSPFCPETRMDSKTVRFLYSQRCKEIRAQLVEQLKCLDQQCELRVQLLQDLQDFFRKKAEIEMDYSRNLEKLAERFLTKTRSTKDHLLKYEATTHSHIMLCDTELQVTTQDVMI
uniref:SLIT-ROBO Rho GTPase-activating protein 2C-like n=1 Tax=Acanthochromis polyacanthus TaxID=80966 RepID=A0A3Q1FD76_9TELE